MVPDEAAATRSAADRCRLPVSTLTTLHIIHISPGLMLTAPVQEDGGPGAARGQAAAHPADRLRGPAVARQHQRHNLKYRYSVDIQ